MRGIRGAITVEKNTQLDILKATEILLKEIIKQNNINEEEIVSIFFTATEDLDREYPAVAARNLGYKYIPLMCYQEQRVKNSLPRCIRVMFFVNRNCLHQEIKHVYLKKAKSLRPDLSN